MAQRLELPLSMAPELEFQHFTRAAQVPPTNTKGTLPRIQIILFDQNRCSSRGPNHLGKRGPRARARETDGRAGSYRRHYFLLRIPVYFCFWFGDVGDGIVYSTHKSTYNTAVRVSVDPWSRARGIAQRAGIWYDSRQRGHR